MRGEQPKRGYPGNGAKTDYHGPLPVAIYMSPRMATSRMSRYNPYRSYVTLQVRKLLPATCPPRILGFATASQPARQEASRSPEHAGAECRTDRHFGSAV